MITYTRLRCNHCNILIQCNMISYIAFDGVYCSNMCRNEKVKVIKAIDPTYNFPSKWQPLIRKTKSCIDIDKQNELILPRQQLTYSNSGPIKRYESPLNIIIENEKNNIIENEKNIIIENEKNNIIENEKNNIIESHNTDTYIMIFRKNIFVYWQKLCIIYNAFRI